MGFECRSVQKETSKYYWSVLRTLLTLTSPVNLLQGATSPLLETWDLFPPEMKNSFKTCTKKLLFPHGLFVWKVKYSNSDPYHSYAISLKTIVYLFQRSRNMKTAIFA